MKVLLNGFQDMKFQTADGEVDGVKLHYSAVDPNVYGRTAENKFIPRHVFDTFGISLKKMQDLFGAEINLDFNGKGKIVGFSV
jgi:hypothetical protein